MTKTDGVKIMLIIRDCCALTEDGITPESEIKTLSIDSLSFVELIVNLETEFGIEFEDEQLNIYDYVTVQDIINAVTAAAAVEERKNA